MIYKYLGDNSKYVNDNYILYDKAKSRFGHEDQLLTYLSIQDLDIVLQVQSTDGIDWKMYKHTTGSFPIENAFVSKNRRSVAKKTQTNPSKKFCCISSPRNLFKYSMPL